MPVTGVSIFKRDLDNLIFEQINSIASSKATFEQKAGAANRIKEAVEQFIAGAIKENNELDEVIDRLSSEITELKKQLTKVA